MRQCEGARRARQRRHLPCHRGAMTNAGLHLRRALGPTCGVPLTLLREGPFGRAQGPEEGVMRPLEAPCPLANSRREEPERRSSFELSLQSEPRVSMSEKARKCRESESGTAGISNPEQRVTQNGFGCILRNEAPPLHRGLGAEGRARKYPVRRPAGPSIDPDPQPSKPTST